MDFYEKLKGFLGIPARDSHANSSRGRNDIYSEMFGDQAVGPTPPGPQGRSYGMLTDPLEIHRYFEQQMQDMLRNFGFDGGFSDGFIQPRFPEIEGPDVPAELPEGSGNLRDQYLKPGYEKMAERNASGHDKMDQDLDGKLDMGDVFSIFDGDKRNRQLTPYQHQRPPQGSFYCFGKSSSIRTVMNPDGSTETHKTVRDHEGNEETTVTRQMGDKQYTIIKRKDKAGQEEIIENLVNMDENEAKTLKPLMPPSDDGSWLRFWKF